MKCFALALLGTLLIGSCKRPIHPAAMQPAADQALAALPRDGALYGTLRLSLLDAALPWVPGLVVEEIKTNLQQSLGLQGPLTTAGISEGLGLDPTRPVVFAIHPGGHEGETRSFLDRVKAAGATQKAVHDAYLAIHGQPWPITGGFRFVIPLRKPDKTKLLDLLKRLPMGTLRECSTPDACKAFGAERPVLFSSKMAIYLSADALRIDGVNRIDETTNPDWLAWFNFQKGGPSTHCQQPLDESLLSMCLSAPEFAMLGENLGAIKILDALESFTVNDAQRASIYNAGLTELGRNTTLAQPLRPGLSEGTFSITMDKGQPLLKASWKLDPVASQEERCVPSLAQAATTLLPPLIEKLSAAKPRYSDLPQLRQHIMEAGWSAYPILAAGQWTLLLPHIKPADLGMQAGVVQVCTGMANGRLQMRVKFDPGNMLGSTR
jgi:hypothetical protein